MINNTLINNAKHLDVLMPMCNLFEYRKNYSETSGSMWNHFKSKANSGAEGNKNYYIKDSKSFDYKTSIIEKSENYHNCCSIKTL